MVSCLMTSRMENVDADRRGNDVDMFHLQGVTQDYNVNNVVKATADLTSRQPTSEVLHLRTDEVVESYEEGHTVVHDSPSTLTPVQRKDVTTLITSSGSKSPSRCAAYDKPEVILLGRGNSFSLGRSEVILLHKKPSKKRRTVVDPLNQNENHPLGSITEQTGVPSSPPPISDGVSLSRTNGWHGKDAVEEEASVDQLWARAEQIMAASQGSVLKVLEEFGIGEPGGCGGGDEGGQPAEEEEERIWHIVEESSSSQTQRR